MSNWLRMVVLPLTLGIIGSALVGAAEPPSPFEATPVRAFRSFDRRTNRGLPQSSVMSLAQDREGVLWIATLDGLATFDGRAVETVAHPQDMPGFEAVFALLSRRDGGVYAGGSTGVHVFDGKRWTHLASPGAAMSLAETGEGELWMVDQGGGLWRCRGPHAGMPWEHPEVASSVPGPAVSVSAPGDGSVYVAGAGGVIRVAGKKRAAVANGASLSSPITALHATRTGVCWVGTRAGGVYWATVDAPTWQRVELHGWEGGYIRCITRDRRGRVWAGGANGYVCFGSEREPWRVWTPVNGLKPSGIMAILPDREGSIWFGFNGDGLEQWHGEAWSHRTAWSASDPSSTRLTVFGISGLPNGGWLAAAFSKGVWRWDGTRLSTYGKEQGLAEDVRCPVEPTPGLIWVGARFGIFESRGGARFRQTMELDNGFVTGLYQSPSGDWYGATSTAGIYAYDGARWKSAESLNRSLRDENVRGISWRSNGEMWVATMRGVAVFGKDGVEWLSSATSPGLPESTNCVLDVSPDEVWVGGMGGIGVFRGGAWRLLSEADGLPGRTVYSLARAKDGTIWAGGSSGVGHYSAGKWTVYDARNGLIEDECNLNGLFVQPDGGVLVGTMASLAHFDPHVQPLPRPMLHTYWRVFPGSDPEAAARLPLGQRWVRATWVAPWLLPTPVEYRTRVGRLRPEWSGPQQIGEISLENLAPGVWDVDVSARLEGGGEGGWTPPLHLHLFVPPRFWETMGARAGIACLGFLGLIGLVRLRTRQLRSRAEQLQRGIDEAVANMRILRGLLPICAYCKKVRDDAGYWKQIETYIRDRSEAEFSHGICPECFDKLYPDYAAEGPTTRESSDSAPGVRRE